MELMELDEIEASTWIQQAERRFKIIQEKRAEIPKRATAEQRKAFLDALGIVGESLQKTGRKVFRKNLDQEEDNN